MLICMTETTGIMTRASELAEKNPPGVAFKNFGILLENLFLGFFACVAWVIGRTWFYGSQLLYAAGLAFADGYRKGAKVPPKVPRQLNSSPIPGHPDLMADSRIADGYTTPFGVPYGPNVQANHE